MIKKCIKICNVCQKDLEDEVAYVEWVDEKAIYRCVKCNDFEVYKRRIDALKQLEECRQIQIDTMIVEAKALLENNGYIVIKQ